MQSSIHRRALLSCASLLTATVDWRAAATSPAVTPPAPILVTGSSSGIGQAVVNELATNGRFVLCAARTATPLSGCGITLNTGLELSDLASVRSYMERLHSELRGGVEGALLCAGVEALPLRRSPQALEMTFAVNTLSHFVIAVELAARAAAEGRTLRLVSVTSSAAFDSRLGTSSELDLNWERRAYNAREAYVDSKACNVLIADELQRRLTPTSRLLACSADPGPTASMLVRYALPQRAAQRATMNNEQLARQARSLGLRTPAQAARGLVWCLTADSCVPGALYLGAAAPPDSPPPLPRWEQPVPWRDATLAAAVWRECTARTDQWLSPAARKFVA